MKLATFSTTDSLAQSHSQSSRHVGALTPDQNEIIDLVSAARKLNGRSPKYLGTMQTVIEAGQEGLEALGELYTTTLRQRPEGCLLPLAKVTLHAPLQPVKLRCFSVYEKHLTQALDSVLTDKLALGKNSLTGPAKLLSGSLKPLIKRMALKSFFEHPTEFKGNHLSVVGPEAEVQWPAFPEDKLDYEMELGVVIGRRGSNISAGQARSFIFGYTCYNDFSARSTLIRELTAGRSGPMKGKDFDTGNALGPWIVTADSITDPYDLNMEVKVNGEVRGKASTGEMYHTIESMIEQASRGETLYPGEVLGTGCAPNGAGIERGRFLKPNDIVEISISGIGTLRNRVVQKADKQSASSNGRSVEATAL